MNAARLDNFGDLLGQMSSSASVYAASTRVQGRGDALGAAVPLCPGQQALGC